MDLIYFTGLKNAGWEVLAQHILNNAGVSGSDIDVDQNSNACKFNVLPCDETLRECLSKNESVLCIAFVSDPVISAFNNAVSDVNSFSSSEFIDKWREVTSHLLSINANSNVVLVSTSDVLQNTSQFIHYINAIASSSIPPIDFSTVYNEQKNLSFGFSSILNINEDIVEQYENAVLRTKLFGHLEYLDNKDAAFSDYVAAITTIRNDIAINHEKLSAQHNENALLVEKIQEYKKREDELRGDTELALSQIQSLKDELEISYNKQKAAEEKNELLSKSVQEAENRYAELEVVNNGLQKNVEKVQEEKKQALQELTHQIESYKKQENESKRDSELALRQIHKLQEKLEISYNKQKTAESKNELLSKSVQEVENKRAELEAVNNDLQKNVEKVLEEKNQVLQELTHQIESYRKQENESKRDSELALRQIHKLQEELEISYNKQKAAEDRNKLLSKSVQEAENKYAELEAVNNGLQKNVEKVLEEKKQALQELTHQIESYKKYENESKRDSELALRQIHKLQEELEKYYIKALELEEKAPNWNAEKYTSLKRYDVLQGAFCSEVNILECYEEAHYAHLTLTLSDILLADGRQIDTLECKLVNNSGFVGLEIRAGDNGKQEHLLDSWPEELNDEFGQKVLFHPGSPSSEFPYQQVVEWQMSASDRVLFFGVINSIKEHFAASTYINCSSLTGSEAAAWQKVAVALFNKVTKMPDWFSFDTVSLKEEMRLDNYEHLWLCFNNLLHGVRFFDNYQAKVNVTELGNKKCFANHLAIEFRALPNNKAPLESWPPSQQDEYGYWLQVDVDLTKRQLVLDGADHLTETDVSLIKHLLANFKFIVERLRDEGQTQLQRNWEDWVYLGNKLHQMHLKSNADTFARRTKRLVKRFNLREG